MRYVFADCVLAPDERSLVAAGRPAKLGGRAFDVLLTLVEQRHRTVPKQELLDRVWPKLVVEENNLQVQVVALRKLLGAHAIATIPGRGYRFTLPVEAQGASAAVGAPASDADVRAGARPHGPRTNLPARIPELFGRDADVAAVRALLDRSSVVAIVGAGGIGKTRVAQAVALAALDDHPDGVSWIELASLSDPSLVVTTVARGLGIPVTGEREVLDAVLGTLKAGRSLLILDNCEHLLEDVAAFVEAASGAAPDVRFLVTSQEPLHSAREHVYRLGPLGLPMATDPDEALRAGAVALFAARAQAVDRRFRVDAQTLPAVVEVCRRLDGIPLAIELAAARLPLLGLDGLRARLDERFKLLTAGSRMVLRRHQTLRATLEWSHALLKPAEQVVLRRLGVFAGSFSLEFAQAVASDDEIDGWAVLDHLGALVEKSLVLAEGDPVPRYRLLETTRAYALEKLAEAGETDQLLRRHAHALVAWIEPLLERRRNMPLDAEESATFVPELENVRAALAWAATSGDDELAIRLAGMAWIVWAYGEAMSEGLKRCLELKARVHDGLPKRVVAQFWNAITSLGVLTATAEAFDAARHEVALLRELGDEARLFIALPRLAAMAARRGERAVAEAAIAEAMPLERPAFPARHRAHLQWSLHCWHAMQGRDEEALAHALRQADLYGEDGGPEARRYALGTFVAMCEVNLGRIDEAVAHARGALAPADQRVSLVGYVHEVLATAATLKGHAAEAVIQGRLAVPDLRRTGDEARLLETLALNAALTGRLAEAASIAAHVDAEFGRTGEVRWPAAASRRARLDALLAEGLAAADLARLRAAGASAPRDQVVAMAVAGSAGAGAPGTTIKEL